MEFETLDQVLRALRGRAGITLTDVSEQVGTGYSATHSYFSGRTRPTEEQLDRILEVLGASIPERTLAFKLGWPHVAARILEG